MSVPVYNTEYTNHQGSIISPCGAITPYAGEYSTTSDTAPSGYLFCDGNFALSNYYKSTSITDDTGLYVYATTQTYTINSDNTITYTNLSYITTDSVYYNLYQTIGTKYGSVAVTIGSSGSSTNYVFYLCFRTPNLMNQDTPYKQDLYPFENFDSVNYVPTTTTPFAYTTVAASSNSVNSINKINLTSEAQLYSHSHGITQNPHEHPLNAQNQKAGIDDVNNQNAQTTNAGGINTPYTGTYANADITINNTGGDTDTGIGADIPLPVVPSFAMPYLIKL